MFSDIYTAEDSAITEIFSPANGLLYMHCGQQVVATDTTLLNLLTPNDPYTGRTAPLTSKRYVLHIFIQQI